METGGLGQKHLPALSRVEWGYRHSIVNVTILHPNMEARAAQGKIPKNCSALFQKTAQRMVNGVSGLHGLTVFHQTIGKLHARIEWGGEGD